MLYINIISLSLSFIYNKKHAPTAICILYIICSGSTTLSLLKIIAAHTHPLIHTNITIPQSNTAIWPDGGGVGKKLNKAGRKNLPHFKVKPSWLLLPLKISSFPKSNIHNSCPLKSLPPYKIKKQK